MAKTMSTVQGRDIEPGQVFKLDGRWVRLVRWEDDDMAHVMRFALVAPHDVDPRMALAYPKLRRLRTGRFVWLNREYLTREQPAVEWEWVAKMIEREGL